MADEVAIRFLITDDGRSENERPEPAAPIPRPSPSAPIRPQVPLQNPLQVPSPVRQAANVPDKPIAGRLVEMIGDMLGPTGRVIAKSISSLFQGTRDSLPKVLPVQQPPSPKTVPPTTTNAATPTNSNTIPIRQPQANATTQTALPSDHLSATVPMPVTPAAATTKSIATANTVQNQIPQVLPAGGGAANIAGLISAVGTGVAIATAIKVISQAIGGAVRGAIEGTTSVAKQAIAGDEIGALANAAKGAADAWGNFVGTFVPPAGEVIKTFGTIVKAGEDLTRSFLTRAQELTPYSGQIAGAFARQTIRDIMANIQESQQLGDQYAALIDAWGDLKQELRQIMLPIKEWMLGTLAKIIQAIADAVGFIHEKAIAIEMTVLTIGEVMGKIASFNYAGAIEAITQLPERIADAQEKRKIDKKEVPSPIEDFFNSAKPPNRPDYVRNDPLKKAADARLQIPAFAGIQ